MPKLESGIYASRKYGVGLLGSKAIRDQSGELIALLPWADDALVNGIVRACNAHEKLAEALQAIRDFWHQGNAPLSPGALITDGEETIKQVVEQALRLAQGEK